MNGYDTDFGQLECINLMSSNEFSDKRIGYLGLAQLFNEKSDILLLVRKYIFKKKK